MFCAGLRRKQRAFVRHSCCRLARAFGLIDIHMSVDTDTIIKQFVDYLMPQLTPHEASLYIFLLRRSWLDLGESKVRIGQRTIAQLYGRGPKMAVPSRAHILRQVKALQQKGCLRISDTNRDGTLYEVVLPKSVPSVVEKLQIKAQPLVEEDFYNDPAKRTIVYERDHWLCFYCGERVTQENVTLDHYLPVSKGGSNAKDNLKTACLVCNSIKSGKTYEEAIPYLYKSIQERARQRNQI